MNKQIDEIVIVESNLSQCIRDIINDEHLNEESIDDVMDNKYIRGSIDTLVTVELNGSVYEFIYQENESGYFSLYIDGVYGDKENIARYINDIYHIDTDHDDFGDKITELAKRYIDRAQEAFDAKLEEIKLELQNS